MDSGKEAGKVVTAKPGSLSFKIRVVCMLVFVYMRTLVAPVLGFWLTVVGWGLLLLPVGVVIAYCWPQLVGGGVLVVDDDGQWRMLETAWWRRIFLACAVLGFIATVIDRTRCELKQLTSRGARRFFWFTVFVPLLLFASITVIFFLVATLPSTDARRAVDEREAQFDWEKDGEKHVRAFKRTVVGLLNAAFFFLAGWFTLMLPHWDGYRRGLFLFEGGLRFAFFALASLPLIIAAGLLFVVFVLGPAITEGMFAKLVVFSYTGAASGVSSAALTWWWYPEGKQALQRFTDAQKLEVLLADSPIMIFSAAKSVETASPTNAPAPHPGPESAPADFGLPPPT